ncbi:hypothetical protein Micbo1qcDRAFT_193213 [Microdochium bolleyi]|uniref:Uncharacterized protein n=1 Tax=Microdochium bolleyi TaxID=196109 RepID=A0A136JA05_9PEZI|nr:hypothetical protein Micbo1qcDRAFT_193213 [Microdochium bolleyi]
MRDDDDDGGGGYRPGHDNRTDGHPGSSPRESSVESTGAASHREEDDEEDGGITPDHHILNRDAGTTESGAAAAAAAAETTHTRALLLEPISGATLYEMEMRRRLLPVRSSSTTARRAAGADEGGRGGGQRAEAGVMPRSPLRLGCREIDDYVLIGGGFERGSVFGVSSENAEFGMLVGLQTLARTLVFEDIRDAPASKSAPSTARRAAIITTLPASAILSPLQNAVRAQVLSKHGGGTSITREETDAETRACLGRVSISRIFDVVGLWQVLDEIEASSRAGQHDLRNVDVGGGKDQPKHAVLQEGDVEDNAGEAERHSHRHADTEPIATGEDGSSPLSSPPATHVSPPSSATSLPPLRPPLPSRRVEIFDSEDDEDEMLSSPPGRLSTKSPEEPQQNDEEATAQSHQNQNSGSRRSSAPPEDDVTDASRLPDMILLTHFSTLLSTLFTQSGSDRSSAHTTLQLLSSHLRYLARSSGSVVMLLNTTAAAAAANSNNDMNRRPAAAAGAGEGPDEPGPGAGAGAGAVIGATAGASSTRPLDPTLRSIFNPAPITAALPHDSNYDYNQDRGAMYAAATAANTLSRRNKPSFGLTFAQFLDVHLLCTRIPRTRADAEAMVTTSNGAHHPGQQQQPQRQQAKVEYCWAVEVLLDELGVWLPASAATGDGGGGGKVQRDNREQRWGAVQVSRATGQIEDAFGERREEEKRRYEELVGQGSIRLAAGFGGRRV